MNTEKTTIMICGTGLDLLQRLGNFPCVIYRTGVGSNTEACFGCAKSTLGSSAFKRAQTTGALDVKEPSIEQYHRRRFRLYTCMTN